MPTAAASNILPRLNYGVIFQQEARLSLSREYWLHTYEIILPEHVNIPPLGTCHQDNNTCLLISHVLSQLNAIRLETEARLNNTLETVHKLVPHASFVHNSRTKRALLNFIGKFSKTLFGTATVDDVNVLAKHINALTKRTKNLGDALVQHNQHLSSFMQSANQRMDNLMQGIKENNIAIHYVTTQLKRSESSLQRTFQDMTAVLVHQLQNANALNHQLDELKLGILDLANGRLSPLIIPLDTLQSTLNNVQSILSKKYPGFYVATIAAAEMYQNSNFLYTRNDSVLYVTVKIPITNSEHALHLYKVTSKPVPINDTSIDATQLLDLPAYFAISHNQQFYLLMTQSQLETCKGTHHKFCHLNLPLIPILKDTCSLALFANSRDKIHKLCQFRFIQKVIKPEVIELNYNQVLLYQSPILSMECNGEHKMIKGCNFCIFDLPCQCSLSSTDFFLPPRLVSCKNNTQMDIDKLHPVNLVLLQEFFDNNRFQHIFADSTFQNPLNVSVPQFRVYQHKMSDVLTADERNHLNLSKMVEIAKNDGIVFQTLAEPILDGHIAIQSNWPDLNGILVLIAVCLGGLTLFFLIYLFFKVKKLAAALIILQQTVKVKALPSTLPSFIYQNAKTTTDTSFNIEIFLSWEHANFIFLFLNFLVLIVILVKLFKFRKTPTLMLEITNMKHCVFVPIMKLPLCPSHSNLSVPETISDLKVSGPFFKPKLQITWSDFTVQDVLTDNISQVPEEVTLTIFQSRKIARILQTPFFVHIHSEHNGYLSPVSFDN